MVQACEVRDMHDDPDYPESDRVGETRTWTLEKADGSLVKLSGRFLGTSSSRSPRHRHPGTPLASAGERCSACRWTEFRLYRETSGKAPHRYYLHTVGCSAVPGERDFPRLSDPILTAPEVISHLTRRKPGQVPFLTVPADMVLAQASAYDTDVRDAYGRRAVL